MAFYTKFVTPMGLEALEDDNGRKAILIEATSLLKRPGEMTEEQYKITG